MNTTSSKSEFGGDFRSIVGDSVHDLSFIPGKKLKRTFYSPVLPYRARHFAPTSTAHLLSTPPTAQGSRPFQPTSGIIMAITKSYLVLLVSILLAFLSGAQSESSE